MSSVMADHFFVWTVKFPRTSRPPAEYSYCPERQNLPFHRSDPGRSFLPYVNSWGHRAKAWPPSRSQVESNRISSGGESEGTEYPVFVRD